MRLWFSSSSEVPIYRQLVTQVVLAILCEDLRPGDRLLSADLSLIPAGASAASYSRIFRETNFLLWLWNSLVITCVTSFIGVSLASTAGLAGSVGRAELQRGWKSILSDLEDLKKVTNDDIKRVAAKYFVKDNSLTAIYKRKMGR